MSPVSPRLPDELSFEALGRAHRRAADTVLRTPVLTAGSISEQLGGSVVLKAENLQRTGSFKIRGALNKLRTVGAARGVVAGSAGNHAQALAYAARNCGLPCEVFMPVDASIGKLAAVRAFGAVIEQRGATVDECVEHARERAIDAGLVFVHPFDDLDVIVGQAGVGIEIIDDVPGVSAVVVPIGGGGLISGVAAAIRQRRPEVRIIGVQAERCAPFLESAEPRRTALPDSAVTIADGIAVKRPGEVTRPLVVELVDEVVSVSEAEITAAMAILMERSKLIVEGAGAASLAVLMSTPALLDPDGDTVAVLSGGNVDVGLLATVAVREETMQGRRLRLSTRVSDRPGGLAALLTTIAGTRANLVAVDHVRESVELDVRETGIELTLETRGHDHAQAVREALRVAGYGELGA